MSETYTTDSAEALAEEIWAESASPGAAPTDAHRDLAQALIASGAVRRETEVRAEALREMAQEFRERASRAWGGDGMWMTTGNHVANLAADWITETADDILDAAALAEGGDR